MRPGPDSPISPHEQVAFYDPGLGAGETDDDRLVAVYDAPRLKLKRQILPPG